MLGVDATTTSSFLDTAVEYWTLKDEYLWYIDRQARQGLRLRELGNKIPVVSSIPRRYLIYLGASICLRAALIILAVVL